MIENQVRHVHRLDYVGTKDGMDEFHCPICNETYYQVIDCNGGC